MATKKKPEPPRPIIVKKITMVAAGHHGGAWKVAYADFVTAMMAFFLLLWILGATTEKQRRGIADYFTPTLVKTKQGSAGSGQGVLGGASLTQVDNYPFKAGQTGTKTLTIPRDATGGPKEGASKIRRSSRTKEALEKKLASTERLRRLARQVRMVDTTQGVRIDMVDDADFSMFRLGTTILTPQAVELLAAISQAIGPGGGALTIRGHTDALPYREGVPGNNWSLSAGRAEATRQQLIRNDVESARFRRIEGVADTELLIPADPHDPRNRRISITLAD
ncbi:flagellar motor protein MotB [Novosphingobium sp. TCA1]|uniref:Flagellar motor protein n=1 Tax=Novosphingobium pentaromativorans TaxID=205844 RepID=A0A2W5NMG2_9SPHN|nr:flagellar motor protein MotB [Novosphingobium sp. TCA1]PZQ54662.1 MAG: flagellar motor protein [Novosphingobium pentaromativorans]GFE75137.1 flagellar motor protein MotB [Novosphingobium sp. TCA1]